MPTLPPLPRRPWLTRLGLLSLAPLLQACSPLRLIDATVPDDTHERQPGLAYGPDPRHRLDLYRPRAVPGGAPIALFFYGGSWSSGERSDYRFVGEALASRGIVTLVADYRLSPAVRYPAFLQDAALATRWARDRAAGFGADPRQLHLIGHSAGAYNVAMLALDPRWLGEQGLAPADSVAGWTGLAGPYDFLPIGVPEVRTAFDWPNTPPDSQPLWHARRTGTAPPPALLLAARRDDLVDPRRNTEALASALRERGSAVQSELFDRVGHATLVGAFARPLRGLAPVLDRVAGFVAGGAYPTGVGRG